MARGDMMIGAGGRARYPRSESAVLDSAITRLRQAHSRQSDPHVASEIHGVIADLRIMRENVAEGFHRNPSSSRTYEPFRVVGVIGKDVHGIAYKHAKDGKLYKHDFETRSAQVLAVERHGKRELLIASTDGVPLWDEF